MANKLAIDWDNHELRLVAAQSNGRSVKVTDASVIPIENGDIDSTLRKAIGERGLHDTETLVAIGRGRAELRELQLPPVPEDELPDMVRFQAIRSFATAGDSATVDFMVTKRSDSGVELIAAAVGPSNLSSIQKTCEEVQLPIKRISLRPLAAAALHLIKQGSYADGGTVLIDLLADDAEIVVASGGKVIFVRTVRMPNAQAARGRVLAGELKRSLMACGSSGSIQRVILWGLESVHFDEKKILAEASGGTVEVVNPFDLVDVGRKVSLPDHLGRLAPLVGLLVADDSDGDLLIDFLNPRQKRVAAPSPYRNALLVGVPVVLALLLAFGIYRRLAGLDQQIADLKSANNAMLPEVDRANESLAKTETVDQFLDGDVNWLEEIRRLADRMPPSEDMIVRSVSATSNARGGGGTLKVEGGVINPAVIDDFEQALRDETHQVKGDGASEQKTEDAYRWGFTEAITLTGTAVRNKRYEGILAVMQQQPPPPPPPPPPTDPEQPDPEQPDPEQPDPEQPGEARSSDAASTNGETQNEDGPETSDQITDEAGSLPQSAEATSVDDEDSSEVQL